MGGEAGGEYVSGERRWAERRKCKRGELRGGGRRPSDSHTYSSSPPPPQTEGGRRSFDSHTYSVILHMLS